MKAGVAAARALPGPLLATLLAACGAGGTPPAPNDPLPPPARIAADAATAPVTGAGTLGGDWPPCARDLISESASTLRIVDADCAQLPETVWPAVGRFPLLATQARPADVDPGGVNEIGVEERKVAAVAVAAITDALQRGLVGGPGHGAGLRGGAFSVAWGPQLTLTLFNCAFTTDVVVSGLVTWAHADIFGDGGFLPAYRPLTADLVVGGPGTVGGTLHVAGSWLSNDPNGYFSVTGALGGKQVAVLVPETSVAPAASPEASRRCLRVQTAASAKFEQFLGSPSCTPRGPARQRHQPRITARSVSWPV